MEYSNYPIMLKIKPFLPHFLVQLHSFFLWILMESLVFHLFLFCCPLLLLDFLILHLLSVNVKVKGYNSANSFYFCIFNCKFFEIWRNFSFPWWPWCFFKLLQYRFNLRIFIIIELINTIHHYHFIIIGRFLRFFWWFSGWFNFNLDVT